MIVAQQLYDDVALSGFLTTWSGLKGPTMLHIFASE